MRHFFSLSALALALPLAACGDSAGPSDMIPEALSGFWEAAPSCLPECGFTLVRIDNVADSVNFVRALQQRFVLNMTTSGRFNLLSVDGGTSVRGRVEAVGQMLILRDEAGTQDTADYLLEGEYLALEFRDVTEQFDFDDDGIGDPSTIRARFRRQE
jgi:hypothetical protein